VYFERFNLFTIHRIKICQILRNDAINIRVSPETAGSRAKMVSAVSETCCSGAGGSPVPNAVFCTTPAILKIDVKIKNMKIEFKGFFRNLATGFNIVISARTLLFGL